MEKLIKHTGIAAVLNKSNVDTDQIIPKQFLKKIERTGFGIHLFHDWRFLDEAGQKENPDFVLNQEPYRKASILISGENFGCGSSREHAPWALFDFGFRVIIAPSYADIFFNNAYKNGMLPLILPVEDVKGISDYVSGHRGIELTVDLENQMLKMNEKEYRFEMDHFRKECLMNGWDDIGLSLRHEEKITLYEKRTIKDRPFIFLEV